jgi:hypothetical protein
MDYVSSGCYYYAIFQLNAFLLAYPSLLVALPSDKTSRVANLVSSIVRRCFIHLFSGVIDIINKNSLYL